MRQHIRAAISRAGFDVRRHDPRSSDEAYLALLIQDLGIRHVIDVGANVGQFGKSARTALTFDGRIDSYEPGAAAFAELRATAEGDKEWHVHHAALTDTPGQLTLNVFDHSDLSSLSTPTAEGASLWAENWSGTPETVDGRRLDQENIPDLGPTLLKLDTQGHDWQVIEAAGSVLDRVDLMMVELSFISLYRSSKPAWTTIGALHAKGFGLAALTPITRPTGEHRLLEADGVFVRAGSRRT